MKYQIIYADPPWTYNDCRKVHQARQGTAERHYPTMPIGAIKNLPVSDLADTNCMLFMWATFPNLREGLAVIEAWGFDYKTVAFTWVKTNRRQVLQQASFLPTDPDLFFGIGYYTKSNAEVCLLGVRGRPIKVSDSVSSVVIAPLGKHSAKPPEVRDRIVELCGDVPRVELFSRGAVPGWDCWGNEVESDISLGVEAEARPQPITSAYAKSFASIEEGLRLAERAYEKLPNHYNEGRRDVYRACRNIMAANDIA